MQTLTKLILSLCLMFSTLAAAKTVVLTSANTVSFNNYYEDRTVAQAIEKIRKLDSALPSGDPIYLVINSGGGSITAGLELINVLQNMNRKVHTITIFSASMGFQTVQGLGDRLLIDSGVLMSHKASGGFWGEFPGQIDSRYSHWLKRVQRLDTATAKRSKMSLKTYNNLIENEYWCEGQECVSRGFADAVVSVRCDTTLSGTYNDVDKWIYSGMPIELVYTFSNCPIQTGMLDWNVYVAGKPFFERVTDRKPDAFGSVDLSPTSPDMTKEERLKFEELLTQKVEERNNKAAKFKIRTESGK